MLLVLLDDMLDHPHGDSIPKCCRQEYSQVQPSERLREQVQVEDVCFVNRPSDHTQTRQAHVSKRHHEEEPVAVWGSTEGLHIHNQADRCDHQLVHG